MKKLLVGGLLAALSFFGQAHAQDQALVVTTCGTPPVTYTAGQIRMPTVDTTGKLCLSVSGAITATSLALGGATIGTDALAVTGGVTINGQLKVISSGTIGWSNATEITNQSDGVIALFNFAHTGFSRLQFGGTTSSFPAIKRNGNTLDARLADDSAYARMNASRYYLDTGGPIYWGQGTGTQLYSTSDGNLLFSNTAGTAALLVFGNTTPSFPAIKRNGTGLNFRLADDSGDAPISVSFMTVGSSTALATAAGGLGFAKTTAAGVAPGATGGRIELICGTNAGSAKLQITAGTSNTPVVISDNIGAGVTGC